MKAGECPLLHGHFSGAKTSAVHALMVALPSLNFVGHYISFHGIGNVATISDLVGRITTALSLPPLPAESRSFSNLIYYMRTIRPLGNVLILDDMDVLRQHAPADVWELFNQFVKSVRDASKPRILQSVVCVGSLLLTEGVESVSSVPVNSCSSASSSAELSSASQLKVFSPWGAQKYIEAEHFTLDQHKQFFAILRRERQFDVPDVVVLDIWSITQGHPGLLGHCADHLFSLARSKSSVSVADWKKYSSFNLYLDVHLLVKFRSRFFRYWTPQTTLAALLVYCVLNFCTMAHALSRTSSLSRLSLPFDC